MPSLEMPSLKKPPKKVLRIALLTVLGLALIYQFVESWMDEVSFEPEPVAIQPMILEETTPLTPSEPSSDLSPTLAEVKSVPEDSSGIVLRNSPMTEELTRLLSELELKRVQLATKEVDQKIKEIDGALSPPVIEPDLVIMPGPSVGDMPKVVAIEGLEGQLRAVLQTRNGVKTVRTGDSISEGKVTRITPDFVSLQTGSATINLSFED